MKIEAKEEALVGFAMQEAVYPSFQADAPGRRTLVSLLPQPCLPDCKIIESAETLPL